MGDYFKGWRRRFGLVTLLMACVFTMGWVRSLEHVDTIGIYDLFHRKEFYLQSANSRLLWYWQEHDANLGTVPPPYCGWMTEPLREYVPEHFILSDHSMISFRWGYEWYKIGGGGLCSTETTELRDGIQLYFSYWLVILPLTLISAYLLLSKPRKSTQKKITEPIPEKLT